MQDKSTPSSGAPFLGAGVRDARKRPVWHPTSLLGAFTKARYETDQGIRELVKILVNGGIGALALVLCFLLWGMNETTKDNAALLRGVIERNTKSLDKHGDRIEGLAESLDKHLEEDLIIKVSDRIMEKMGPGAMQRKLKDKDRPAGPSK
jgi:hypothetical protein